MNRKGWIAGVLGLLVALSFSTRVMAQAQVPGGQPQPGQGRGAQQGGFGQGGQMDPQEMQRTIRQTRNDAIKEALGATEDEWAVLGPRIEKINGLNADANTGISGMMTMFGRNRGGRGGGRGGLGGINIQSLMGGSNAMAQKMADLAAAVDNPAMPESEIRSRLAAVRAEREKVRAELAQARAELVQFLTQRQEAVLFQMGVLD